MSEAKPCSTQAEEAVPLTLLQALHRAAYYDSARVAFMSANESITYQEFLLRARELATALSEYGVKHGDHVAVILPRSLEVPIAVYGIWLAGAAYVPLDPELPAAQQIELMRSCKTTALVTHPTLRSLPREIEVAEGLSLSVVVGCTPVKEATVLIGEEPMATRYLDWSALAEVPSTGELPTVSPDDLAYIIHTSGSTGEPKGIMHTHASALRYAELTIQSCDLEPDDTLACHSAAHTDMSSLGLFVAPLLGARTLMIPDSHVRVPASLAQLIERVGVTVWYSVPLALLQLLQHGALEQRDLSSLRWVIYAGEPMARSHIRSLAIQMPKARFSNHYGPAETNVCTYFHLPGDSDYLCSDEPVSIGKPWGQNRIVLVDADDDIVERGNPGELLVSTDTLMLGYWRRPELNRRALVTKSVNGTTSRYYRTGDIAFETEAGELQLVGRRDRQVKVRGYRVELDDIEHRLSNWSGLMGLSAVVVEAELANVIHLAVLDTNDSLDLQAFENYARQVLPPAAIPQYFHRLSTFPYTSSGKVDRQCLVQTVSRLT